MSSGASMNPRPLKIAVVAGEESGDLLGADMVGALRASGRDVRLVGVGGRHLGALGLVSLFDASEIALMGLSAVLRQLPRLMRRLADIAPGVTISTVRNAAVNLSDELEAGRVDIAIGLLPQLKAGFFQRHLFRQRYVCIFREGHALDKDTLSLQDFEAAQHIVVVAGGTGHAIVDEIIEKRAVKRNVRLSVPHFVALGHILSNTDLIATVPERYVREGMAPFKLRYLPHPVPLPEFDVNLFWHAKYHKEPGNQWLRSVIAELAIDQGVGPG